MEYFVMSTHCRLNTSFEYLIALNRALECLRYKYNAMLLAFLAQGWCNVTGIFGAGMMQFELTYYKYFSPLPTPPKELSVYS